ncbi:MAG: type II toxin-antitoxin system prevent-host-death family antitoxin [Vulcanimicrobiaceae bacterium]|jgi:prevent-host-death family protein
MKTIGSYEAKTRLSEILREVEAGETVIVTRNGNAVAKISPVKNEVQRDPRAAMARLLASKVTLGGRSISELRDSGRKR